MSALTKFQPKLTTGHLRYHVSDSGTIDGYIECDGSIVLRNSYSKLFDAIGPISNKLNVGTLVNSGTTQNINDSLYANNTFVYAANVGILATSTDATTWTLRSNSLTYVGGKTFGRAGSISTTNVSLTDLTGGLASAPAAGDVVFIAVSSTNTTIRPVSNYTEIQSRSTNLYLWVGYKVMGSIPDTIVTIPQTGNVDDAQTVAIQVWRNVHPDIFDVTTPVINNEFSVLPNPPSITTVRNESILLVIGAGEHTRGTQTYGASYLDNFLTVGADDVDDSTIGFGSIYRPIAGTYDPAPFIFSSTDDTTFFRSLAVTIALRNREDFNTLTYANNTFVVAGSYGILSTSPDAITWTSRTSGTSNNINALTYGNNTFVYAGDNDTLATSSDAITWTQQNTFPEVSYVGGKTFDRAGSTSTTNLSLTDLTGGTSSAPAAGDIVFIAVATGSTTLRSQAVSGYTQIASLRADDSVDTNLWVGYKVMGSTPDTEVTIPSTGSVDDAQTVAIQVWKNVHPDIFDVTSTTAISGNSVLANPPAITTLTKNSVLLVIGAGGHQRGISTYNASYLSNFLTIGADSTYDSTIGFGSIDRPIAGTYDPAAFTFGGSDSTAFSWAAVTIALRSQKQNINALTYGNGTFVCAGNNGVLATSNDAINWTPRTSGTSNNINALTYGNGTFVYAGNGGVLATSNDAINWTPRTSGTTQNINDLKYDTVAQDFAYVTSGGQLKQLKNLNLVSTTNTSNNLNSIIYNSGYFVYSGNNGTLGIISEYTYDPNIEFILPTSNSIFNETLVSSPRAHIKYE
jgi:hypothetical protein